MGERTEYTLPPVPLDPETGRPRLPGNWFWNGIGEAISQPRRGVEIVCCVGYRDAVTVWNAANDCDPRESEEAPAAVVLACIADWLMSEGEVPDVG